MNFNETERNNIIILVVLDILFCMFACKSKLILGTLTLLLAVEYFCVFPAQMRTHHLEMTNTFTNCYDVFNIS